MHVSRTIQINKFIRFEEDVHGVLTRGYSKPTGQSTTRRLPLDDVERVQVVVDELCYELDAFGPVAESPEVKGSHQVGREVVTAVFSLYSGSLEGCELNVLVVVRKVVE